MRKEDLDAIATREAHCKPYGSAVTLSIGERDELVALARDGMRYRHIRPGNALVWCQAGDDLLDGEELDSAIDAEMAKIEQPA